jgi:hypothetical protein
MPVILDTISYILTHVNVGGDGLNVWYVYRFVYSDLKALLQFEAISESLNSVISTEILPKLLHNIWVAS